MSEVKLLPCPFCGGVAFVETDGVGEYHGRCHADVWVECRSCGARGAETRDADPDKPGYADSATASWNTRANLAERDAEVEALRAEVDRWKSLHATAYDAFRTGVATERRLEARAERLAGALRGVLPFVATQAIGCHGDKCREEWFYSCSGEEEAGDVAQRGREAFRAATAALEQENDDA